MPKLWTETIEAHRREVREAILDTAATLVAEHGPRAVTMSQIAERTGIGRATLYKYFPDAPAILHAWHQRQILEHLEQLTELRDRGGDPSQRLEAVLRAYAVIIRRRFAHEHSGAELAAVLHRGVQVTRAPQRVHDLVRGLLADAAEAGHLREDVEPDVLASYCLNAVNAATALPSEAAIHQLIAVTMAGLHPPR